MPAASPKLTPLMLNHAAWVTHDSEATAKFYSEVMGMELVSSVLGDSVPSTGDEFPYFHIFFKMMDGSTIAFFESPGLPPRSESTHPAYDVFDHIALQARDREEVDQWAAWLIANGVDVVGPTDHGGLIYSIYFHDPNQIRLEITTPLDTNWNNHGQKATADLKAWCDAKKAAQAGGHDVGAKLVDLIKTLRAARAKSNPVINE